jgi:hypothetical protein
MANKHTKKYYKTEPTPNIPEVKENKKPNWSITIALGILLAEVGKKLGAFLLSLVPFILFIILAFTAEFLAGGF